MGATTSLRLVADALQEVERWRREEESRHTAELKETDDELRNLANAISNLEQQQQALARFRDDLLSKVASLPRRGLDRGHQTLFTVMREQSQALEKREAQVADATRKRLANLEATLRQSAVAPLVDEYRQFKVAVEPNLSSLPESYRSVVTQHHHRISERLQEHVHALLSVPVEIKAEPLRVEVVYSVDAPEGTPELLVVVIPVSDRVHFGWVDRQDGLQTWLAARVVQAIHEAALGSGFSEVDPMAGGHMGLLAVEVDLVGAPGPFLTMFEDRLAVLLSGAPELGGAAVLATASQVDADFVMPPEEEAAEEQEVTHAGGA
ncbi:MAG: hypothetical protein KTR31_28790 [Myxococcales bacterium]|nr:hypothetical protein [Myxococcales bacterium]